MYMYCICMYMYCICMSCMYDMYDMYDMYVCMCRRRIPVCVLYKRRHHTPSLVCYVGQCELCIESLSLYRRQVCKDHTLFSSSLFFVFFLSFFFSFFFFLFSSFYIGYVRFNIDSQPLPTELGWFGRVFYVVWSVKQSKTLDTTQIAFDCV